VTVAPGRLGEAGCLRVDCAAAGVALAVPADTSVLEAVRRAGLEVPPRAGTAGAVSARRGCSRGSPTTATAS
jgi:hypothetical protein